MKVEKYSIKVQKLTEEKEKKFNLEKLRRMVIHGIPCQCVPMKTGSVLD